MNQMRLTIYDFEPNTAAEQVLYDQGLTIVHDLEDQRNLRLLEAGVGILGILWGVLVIGGIIVAAFTYLFGLENTGSHRLMNASLAAIVALAIFTIYALDHPFAGITHVQPESFELVLETFEQEPGQS